jgi:hypothetical protein
MFIDATYEGDLMAKAGVSYHVGREANASMARRSTASSGRREASSVRQERRSVCEARRSHQRPAWGITPMPRQGRRRRPHPGLQLPHVQHRRRRQPRPLGQARRTTTKSWFELLLRNCRGRRSAHPWAPTPMPNRKTDTNNNFAFSTDFIGHELRLPGRRLRHAREDLAGA